MAVSERPEGVAAARGSEDLHLCLEIQNVAGFFPLAINFFSVSDLDDQDDQIIILNRVDDPVVSFADTVEMVFPG